MQRVVVIWSGNGFAQRESDTEGVDTPPPTAADIVPAVTMLIPGIMGARAMAAPATDGRDVGAVAAKAAAFDKNARKTKNDLLSILSSLFMFGRKKHDHLFRTIIS
jgi:hypothetical protein